MKTYTGFYYELATKDYGSKFCENYETIEEAIKAREAMRQRQIELGYIPEDTVIVQVMWQRVFDDNGDFVAENKCVIRVNAE